jgi:hypothetical protein
MRYSKQFDPTSNVFNLCFCFHAWFISNKPINPVSDLCFKGGKMGKKGKKKENKRKKGQPKSPTKEENATINPPSDDTSKIPTGPDDFEPEFMDPEERLKSDAALHFGSVQSTASKFKTSRQRKRAIFEQQQREEKSTCSSSKQEKRKNKALAEKGTGCERKRQPSEKKDQKELHNSGPGSKVARQPQDSIAANSCSYFN